MRFLITKLPKRTDGSAFQIGDDVDLQYYRLQKISEGSIALDQGDAEPLRGPTEVGTGDINEEKVQLSLLIDTLNKRFGTDFDKADELFFDQVAEAAAANDKLREAALVNSEDNFEPVFKKMLESLFIERMEGNEEIFKKLMSDDVFRSIVDRYLTQQVYEKIHAQQQQYTEH